MPRLLVFVVLFVLSSATQASTITFSPAQISPNAIPFFEDAFFAGPVRFQQAYDAGEFLGEVLIESVAFYPDRDLIWEGDVEIAVGTTAAGVGGLSDVLSSNPAGPLTQVYQATGFDSGIIAGDVPSLVFNFTAPFLFDPAGGENLLIDITTANQTIVEMPDDLGIPGFLYTDLHVGRAYDTNPTGSGTTAIGLATVFNVPAPVISAPVCFVLFGLMLALLRRRS